MLPQITICRWTKGCWALLTLSLLTLTQQSGFSQPTDPTAFSLVRLEPSARIAALAGAAQSIGRDDPSIVFLNPAVASPDMHRMLSVSYANHLADINAAFLSYVTSMGDVGTVIGGLRYLSYGSFERADENGFRDGTTFSSYESVLTAGLSRSAGQLQYGGTLNLLFSGIDGTTASALAVDAGVLYYKASQQLGLSASAHNVGWVMSSFGQQKDELPFDLRVGASKRLTHLPFMFSLTGYDLHDWDGPDSFGSKLLKHLALGGEFYLGQAVRLRVGYNHRRHDELKTGSRIDLAGVGLGFGVHITRFRFDYAYNDWSSLGGVHHLTIQTRL